MQSKKSKSLGFAKYYFLSLTQTMAISFLGFLLSVFLIFAIAIIEINIFALVININPHFAGLGSDTKTLRANLSKMNHPPNIIPIEDKRKISAAIAISATGTDNFFGENILSAVPGILMLPSNSKSDAFLTDNFLVISGISKELFESIGPHLGYLLLQEYFSDIAIKNYPSIKVLAKDDYLNFRKEDSLEKLKKINQAIGEVSDNISSYSAVVKNGEADLAATQVIVDTAFDRKENRYKDCLSEGTYTEGIFYKLNTKEFCDKQRLDLDNTIEVNEEEANLIKNQIQYAKSRLAEYQYYEEVFKTQKEIFELSEVGIVYEQGIFQPKEEIIMLLDEKNLPSAADFIATLVHEYLHYASFIAEDKKFESLFFEESLTEHFTRLSVANFLGETNSAYSIQAKIISEMTSKIAESDLIDIYFAKDNEALKSLIDRVYGDDFYINNIYLFEALIYNSDQKITLKLANDIMEKIGGTPLKPEDLSPAN
jgi:hypothetical protein